MLRARLVRERSRGLGRWWLGGGDHLSWPDDLRARLLEPAAAERMKAAGGRTDAAVLVALHGLDSEPAVILTERRHDLRRHAGEISFPGGRRDDEDRDLEHTALREAHEEIGLDPADVEVIGALPPFGTFVTNYRVHPFVGLIPDGLQWTLSPHEVETLLDFRISQLRDGFAMRRLVRRGIPFQTPTYEVGRHLVWGATARMLGDLLERLD